MNIETDTVATYRRDGVIVLRQVFSAAWIERLREGLEENTREPGPYRREYGKVGAKDTFFGDYCNWRRIDGYRDFVLDSPAASIARTLMDSAKVNFFHEHVLVKSPGTEEPTPWHHDHPYYCIDGMDTCSLWVPLDPVPKATAVEFIAGSHRWGRLFQPRLFIGDDYPVSADGFEIMPDIDAERDQHRIISFDLQPGDCAAFHFRTVHGAPGNRSLDLWRRAIAFRWTGDDVTFQRRAGVMSPPFHEFKDCKLERGEPLDSNLFPVIDAA